MFVSASSAGRARPARVVSLAAVLALQATRPYAAIAQAPDGPTFDVATVDTALLGAGLWLTSIGVAAQIDRWAETPACRGEPDAETGLCDTAGIFVLDRPTFRHHWRGADEASDVLLLTMLTSPFAYSGIRAGLDDRLDEPLDTFAGSSAVSFQALGAVALATGIVKLIVRRPRPLTYDASFSREERFDGDARLSFPSGHTSMAFGSATLLAVMAHQEIADPGLKAAVIASGFGAASAVGYLRIAARKHFLTDVLAGAALGAGVAGLVAGIQLADDAPDPAAEEVGASQPASVFHFGWGGTF